MGYLNPTDYIGLYPQPGLSVPEPTDMPRQHSSELLNWLGSGGRKMPELQKQAEIVGIELRSPLGIGVGEW